MTGTSDRINRGRTIQVSCFEGALQHRETEDERRWRFQSLGDVPTMRWKARLKVA
jgi:hypothetical protein